MKKRAFWLGWQTLFVAPLVLAAVAGGLWVTVSAAYEDVRLARAADQILAVVAVARDMAVDVHINGDRTTAILLEQLAPLESLHVVKNPDASLQGLANPWGRLETVSLKPSTQIVRFETTLPTFACRRLLLFFSKDVVSLGLLRVETRNAGSESDWQQLYDSATMRGLESPAIAAGCGEARDAALALIFKIR